MIQDQILQTYITRIVRQTVRRITTEILGIKGLKDLVDGLNLKLNPLIPQSFKNCESRFQA